MKKDEFLKKLEKKLSILNEEERKDILDEYKSHIEGKMKDGMTEEEAVKDFGDFDTLVKDILSAYKINENYEEKQTKFESTFNLVVDEMVKFFQKLVTMLSNQKGEDLLRIICKIILVLFTIWILRIPTWIIRELGEAIFSSFPGYLDKVLSVGWSILVETIYVIVSVLMIYTLMKKMVFEDETPSKNIKEAKTEKVVKEKKKTTSKETKETITPAFVNPIMIIVKVFVVLFTLPILCTWLGLAIALGMMVALFAKGIYLVSLFLIIIGIFLMTSAILGMIYHIVWKENK